MWQSIVNKQHTDENCLRLCILLRTLRRYISLFYITLHDVGSTHAVQYILTPSLFCCHTSYNTRCVLSRDMSEPKTYCNK